MKPPITYLGGKTTLAERIANLLPEHEHYVEPFAGSLSVLLAKRLSDHETVNDLDADLVTFWRVLRDQPEELERVCALTPHSRAEHAASYDVVGVPDVERARRVWVQLTQGRAGVRTRTGWRHYVTPAGSSASMPRYLAGYVGRIAPAAARLVGVSLECRPALEVIASYGRDSRVLLYVDPPYLGSARNSGGYLNDMPTEAQHRELAEALRACKAAVVISGYPSDLYDRVLYRAWERHAMPASTGQGGAWANRTEVLWSNRPLPTQMSLLEDEEAAS
ncbi:MAG: DNA adenine methylase [Micromonosporaceae bacterium]